MHGEHWSKQASVWHSVSQSYRVCETEGPTGRRKQHWTFQGAALGLGLGTSRGSRAPSTQVEPMSAGGSLCRNQSLTLCNTGFTLHPSYWKPKHDISLWSRFRFSWSKSFGCTGLAELLKDELTHCNILDWHLSSHALSLSLQVSQTPFASAEAWLICKHLTRCWSLFRIGLRLISWSATWQCTGVLCLFGLFLQSARCSQSNSHCHCKRWWQLSFHFYIEREEHTNVMDLSSYFLPHLWTWLKKNYRKSLKQTLSQESHFLQTPSTLPSKVAMPLIQIQPSSWWQQLLRILSHEDKAHRHCKVCYLTNPIVHFRWLNILYTVYRIYFILYKEHRHCKVFILWPPLWIPLTQCQYTLYCTYRI